MYTNLLTKKNWVRGKTMCLSIDILKSKEEVFDIGYTS